MTHPHEGSPRDRRGASSGAELHGLERMRAPWYFQTEVQRRHRAIGTERRREWKRRLLFTGLLAAAAAGLIYLYGAFGDRLTELLPESAPSDIQNSGPSVAPPTTTPVDTLGSRAAGTEEPATRTPVVIPQEQEARASMPAGVRRDTMPAVVPDTTRDTSRRADPAPSSIEGPDTAQAVSPRHLTPPADSLAPRQDTLRGNP